MFLLFEKISRKNSSIFFYFVHLNVQNFRHINLSCFYISFSSLSLSLSLSIMCWLFTLNLSGLYWLYFSLKASSRYNLIGINVWITQHLPRGYPVIRSLVTLVREKYARNTYRYPTIFISSETQSAYARCNVQCISSSRSEGSSAVLAKLPGSRTSLVNETQQSNSEFTRESNEFASSKGVCETLDAESPRAHQFTCHRETTSHLGFIIVIIEFIIF